MVYCVVRITGDGMHLIEVFADDESAEDYAAQIMAKSPRLKNIQVVEKLLNQGQKMY